MRSPNFYSALLPAVMLLLAACGNNSQSTGSEADTTITTTTTDMESSPPAATSGIITTPQNMMLVVHKVANFDKWKMNYENHDTARIAAGIHSYVIGRGLQDSTMVLVGVKVDDTAKAKSFAASPGLKVAMKEGGVIGTPKFSLTTMVFQDTTTITSNLRSAVSLTVKDWDTWLKSFQEGHQQRLDNGIMVRAYGHDAADNHKVRVVTALLDSAKALAYFKSDTLKKRMAASGVVGQPERFLFRVVQRY